MKEYIDASFRVKMGATFSSEMSAYFTGLHGVISQKTEVFIAAAVRTSNPSIVFCFKM
jgi:hypothetical protein